MHFFSIEIFIKEKFLLLHRDLWPTTLRRDIEIYVNKICYAHIKCVNARIRKLKQKKRPRNESGSDNNENEWLEDREKERKMLKVINARVEKPSHAAAINKLKNHWLCCGGQHRGSCVHINARAWKKKRNEIIFFSLLIFNIIFDFM